jgi:hypothetical protein
MPEGTADVLMEIAAGSLSAGSHPTVPEKFRQAGVNTLIHRLDSTNSSQYGSAATKTISKALTRNTAQRKVRAGLLIACVAGICLAALPASAQVHHTRRESNANRKARIARTIEETYGHRWEAGGGGGFLRFRSGADQQRDNQIGFWASTMYAVNPKLGVIGEIRGTYGHAKLTNVLPCNGNPGTCFLGFNPQISQYNFMAGPSYRFVRKEKFSASVFAEGGMGLGKFDGDSKGLTAADIGVWTGNYGAAFTGGLNLDYNLYPNFALRVTPTYLGTTYGGTLQNNIGVNAGLVYRFGKIK